MADQPFDTTTIGHLERPVSGDHNKNTTQIYRTLRELARIGFAKRAAGGNPSAGAKDGFIADGFQVFPNSPAGMSVIVRQGFGYVYDPSDVPTSLGAPDVEELDDDSPYKPIPLVAQASFAVPTAPAAGQGRTDIIEVRVARRFTDSETRRQFDTGTLAFDDHVFDKTLTFGIDGQVGVVAAGGGNSTAALSYKVGTAAVRAAVPQSRDGLAVIAPPATSPGYVKIAEVQVNSGMTTITSESIVDRRTLLSETGILHYQAQWRLEYNGGSPIVTLLAMHAPPGVLVGLNASGTTRASGIVFVTAGEMVSHIQSFDVGFPSGFSATSLGVALSLGAPSMSKDSSDTLLGLLDTSVPPLNVGATTMIAVRQFTGYAVSNGGTVNQTNALLEDAIVTVTGSIAY